MSKQHELPQADESRRHYSIPEGYFPQLEQCILARLKQCPTAPTEPKPTLWIRLRPIVYLAAVLVSLNLIIRALYPSDAPQAASLAATEQHDEEYKNFYNEYSASISSLEALDAIYSEEAELDAH